jgi:hypothetical protein
MNRILQAEVILTLTADQARHLLQVLRDAPACTDGYTLLGTAEHTLVVVQQCAKQGVRL